jgi:hypothetical protein
MMNAYHREAAVQMLPYSCAYDNDSWWYSQVVQVFRSALLYSGNVLLHPINVVNPAHRPYPKGLDRISEIANDTRNAIGRQELVDSCMKGLGLNGLMKVQGGPVKMKSGRYDAIDFKNAPLCT